MKKISSPQIITILATLFTLTINVLANALPINGLGTGEISDRFEVYFTPAGYVFSIWGIIYIGMIAFTIYQALPSQKENPLIKKVQPVYWVSSLANSGWIFLWHYEFFLYTLFVMIILLVSLIYIYQFVSEQKSSFNPTQRWAIQYTFSIYLGWISVATIANFTQVLYLYEWNAWGISGEIWATIMISIGGLLGLLMLWRENDLAFSLVLIWAFIGITVSQAASPIVVNSAWIICGILIIAILFTIVTNKSTRSN